MARSGFWIAASQQDKRQSGARRFAVDSGGNGGEFPAKHQKADGGGGQRDQGQCAAHREPEGEAQEADPTDQRPVGNFPRNSTIAGG